MPEPARERRHRRRPDLRKLMFVLPNLFTVSSIFCGVYSIMLSAGEATGDNFYRAAIAIFFGNFFDAFDGRVARLTKTQSEFGVELDSLADVITFGVAPAILVYKWSLYELGLFGIAIAGIYAASGAIRLARFNVLARSEAGVQRFFVGLPIPLAAGTLVSLVIALQNQRSADSLAAWPIAGVVLVLAFLMVSTIRYRTFKDAGLNPRTFLVFLLVIAVGVVVSYRGRPSLVLLVYFSFYILLGLAEELLFGRRRRAAARAHGPTIAPVGPESDPEEPLLPAEEDDVGLEGTPAAAGAGGDDEQDA
ncbi:MAG TPA: CDP-diacylglycerol--serine O-phosphatidyltransferase [Myxococcales bacterium]|nr:CDP-diacylglycerol--serine O-phosphatidyltransferase [Myxococcales bacterium]